MGWRGKLSLFLALLVGCGCALPRAPDSIRFAADFTQRQVLFRWRTDRCVQDDIPDAPPRAFRDDHGLIHLFATHEANRAMVGANFDSLAHSCSVVFQGRHADSPAAFSDREWLTAFSTEDGRHIVAIVHDEFQGNLRSTVCPSAVYLACWENALTFAVSDDGGRTFVEPKAPHNVVASIPYRNQGEFGRPIGYFQPSNVVRQEGFYYFMFHAEEFQAQAWGICLARTRNVTDVTSWRAWDGKGFNVRFANPYTGGAADPSRHVCTPVGRGSLFDFGSLTLDTQSQGFVAVTSIPRGSGNSYTPPGVYTSMSNDLVHWSPPALLASTPNLASRDPNPKDDYGFFSLIDHRSASLDFSTIATTAAVFLYYVESNQSAPPYDRNLVRVPVQITLQ